jgi:mannose-6-phosphate isomerase-like protein (cupin superfamily)
MVAGFKRVVTAVDEKGKSIVAQETSLQPVEIAMMPGAEFYSVWGGETLPKVPVERPVAAHQPFFPGPGGSRFGIVRFPPASSATEAELDEAAVNALVADCEANLPGLIGAFDPDGTGMHTTSTVDYAIVLEGELYLELDDGAEVPLPAGTCVVQNGTHHAWRNRGSVPAVLAYVSLGAPT